MILFLVGVMVAGCGSDDGTVTDASVEIQAWLDDEGITSFSVNDGTGIHFYPEVENAGGVAVSSGLVAAIYYTLFDLDNNVIASHQRSDGDSLLVKHDVSAVYPIGLDYGLSVMRVGETYSFLLPPSQAFSQIVSGALSATRSYRLQVQVVGLFNENDLFAQELIDIDQYITDNNLNDTIANPLDQVEQFGSGISYKRIVEGAGPLPINGDTIIVNYDGTFLNGNLFDRQSGFQWSFGSDQPRALIPGFEFGISLMQPQERALLIIPSSQAYRESALVIPSFVVNELIDEEVVPDYVADIPPYRTLIFDITRVD